MILRYLQINLHQMIKMTIFITKDNFSKKQTNDKQKIWLKTVEKVNTTFFSPTRNIKSQHP